LQYAAMKNRDTSHDHRRRRYYTVSCLERTVFKKD
jgi:hypothetical protein